MDRDSRQPALLTRRRSRLFQLDWLFVMRQGKTRKRGLHMGVSRVRARIRAPLPQVWEFLIKPENMHLWEPLTRPVTGFDRPLQAGDRVTLYRRDFFRNHSQVLLARDFFRNHS